MDFLKIFAEDFTKSTGISVILYEDRTTPHWKRLLFAGANCEELSKISNFIYERFYQKGKYSHLLVKLHSYEDHLCLTADVKELERIYKNK